MVDREESEEWMNAAMDYHIREILTNWGVQPNQMAEAKNALEIHLAFFNDMIHNRTERMLILTTTGNKITAEWRDMDGNLLLTNK